MSLLDVSSATSSNPPALRRSDHTSTPGLSPFNLSAFVPSGTGQLFLSIAGVALAQSGYSLGSAPPARLRAVLRTPHVYAPSHGPHDRDEVVVAVQLTDAEGNTQVDLTHLVLMLKLLSSNGTTSATCSVAALTGLATCRHTVPNGWFASGSLETVLQLQYSGSLQLEHAAGNVTLHPAPAQSRIPTSGMTLSLPTSPRFGDDQFTAKASASLLGVTYGLMAWTATLSYDVQLLSLESFVIDGIWGGATTSQTAGELRVLMNCPASCDESNTAVTGEGIPIMSATFRVSSSAPVGSHTSAVSLRVNAMLNFGNNFVVQEQDALVLDGRDGGNTAGELVVELPVVAGLFAYFAGGSATLLNTAPITGMNVSTAITASTVGTRPHAAEYTAVSAACTSPAGSVLALSGCTATASALSSGGGVATIDVNASGLTTLLTLRVWHPAPLSLQLDDETLNRLDGCASGGNGAYQSSRLRVLSGGLDVTPLLGAPGEALARLSVPLTARPSCFYIINSLNTPKNNLALRS